MSFLLFFLSIIFYFYLLDFFVSSFYLLYTEVNCFGL